MRVVVKFFASFYSTEKKGAVISKWPQTELLQLVNFLFLSCIHLTSIIDLTLNLCPTCILNTCHKYVSWICISYLMSLYSSRHLLAFIFIPVIQKEMDIFRETVWNAHRVRSQKDAATPKGIPYHLYSFPDQYNADECGMAILLNMYMF